MTDAQHRAHSPRQGVADLCALLFGVFVFAWLYVQAPLIGYARDEGFYFKAATEYEQWLTVLTREPAMALGREASDAAFSYNHEHPSLMKLLFAGSELIFREKLGWIAEPGQCYRVPSMFLAALGTSMLVGFTSRILSLSAGLVAGGLLITLPRFFHHAHLACFDVPVAVMIFLSTLSYRHAVLSRRWGPALLLGVVFGLALDTKHNAWWLPAVFLVHLVITEWHSLRFGKGRERWLALRPLVVMLVVGPLVLVLLWPWLWHDTASRLLEWVKFHLHHDYYNMEFLGRTYHRPPMPRSYAWVMTAATVPATTLLLALVGIAICIRHAVVSSRGFSRVDAARAARGDGANAVAHNLAGWDSRRSTDLLLGLSLLSAYAPWFFNTTPIFGGTKHWLAAYPFLCVFGARGYAYWGATLRSLWGTRSASFRLYNWSYRLGTVALLSPAAVITWDSVPWGLSSYTPLVGGAPGAANLGLNRTFWGYTTVALSDAMTELAPKGARVFVHDTALQSFALHQLDGTLSRSLSPTLNIAGSDLALYHHEPHMRRVEFQIWEAYGNTAPEAIACFDGVPIVWLYSR